MDTAAFGRLDAKKQTYECHVEDLEGLVKLTDGYPFAHWTKDVDSINVDDFASWFPRADRLMAIYGADEQKGLSYADLHDQIKACPPYKELTTVALLLPLDMRPESAVALVALLSQPLVSVAPLDYTMPEAKMLEAFEQLGCEAIVTTPDLHDRLESHGALTSMRDIRIVESEGRKAGAMHWKILRQVSKKSTRSTTTSRIPENYPRMLLRTSGTTANPKVVALTASQLLHSGASLAYGLKLSPEDVCCCAMPLFHIGGIAGALLCVLVSGSAVVMMPGNFDPQVFLDRLDPSFGDATPTWYYAAPTMHQALILTARAQGNSYIPNKVRLIRSAAAHLPHQVALDLANLFHAEIYPTFGMSECMPIAIPHNGIVYNRKPTVIDTVGSPAACSISIVDGAGEALPYGEIGEISVRGPGAIDAYVGISKDVSHTPSGWLKTGDVGCLDKQGRLFIRGRSKEMIKRGGEQVWPNEVDHVVLCVPGVKVAVTFAVPNELWGEEVAVAVVLEESARNDQESTKKLIMETCKEELDHFAVPQQIIFVESTAALPKGATGKYLRTKVANHLGVVSVDTRAMQALKGIASSVTEGHDKRPASAPSPALNGVRFLTCYFVCQIHIGFYESKEWTKIQSFTMSMPIFFFLVAFQLASSVESDIMRSYGSFVGSKIGAMHAMFAVACVGGLPSFLYWIYEINGEMDDVWYRLDLTMKQTLTGMYGHRDGNLGSTWFQTALYKFIFLFPLLNTWLRKQSDKRLLQLFVISVISSVVIPGLMFENDMEPWHFSVVTWIPHLVASTIAGNLFRRFGPVTENETYSIFRDPEFWGVVSDIMSYSFIGLLIVVGLYSADCLYVSEDTYQLMRPDDMDYKVDEMNYEKVVWICDVTWDEFVYDIRADQTAWTTQGRWEGDIALLFWVYRLGCPLTMIWLYGLAFGRGLTARFLRSRPLQFLSALSYPIYLLHIPLARCYWFATRSIYFEDWWTNHGDYPFPVEYHEMLFILALSGFLGYLLDRCVVPYVVPYSVSYWVFICQGIERLCDVSLSKGQKGVSADEEVKRIVKSISGTEVTLSSSLDSIGLDSLGATAFLGLLRSSMTAAKGVSVQKLSKFETVGDLVDFLSQQQTTEPHAVGKEKIKISVDSVPPSLTGSLTTHQSTVGCEVSSESSRTEDPMEVKKEL